MIDAKKRNTFRVKIGPLADRNGVEFTSRPSDVQVLNLFRLMPEVDDLSHYAFVRKDTGVELYVYPQGQDFVAEARLCVRRRWSRSVPHRLLKRVACDCLNFTSVLSREYVEGVVSEISLRTMLENG